MKTTVFWHIYKPISKSCIMISLVFPGLETRYVSVRSVKANPAFQNAHNPTISVPQKTSAYTNIICMDERIVHTTYIVSDQDRENR